MESQRDLTQSPSLLSPKRGYPDAPIEVNSPHPYDEAFSQTQETAHECVFHLQLIAKNDQISRYEESLTEVQKSEKFYRKEHSALQQTMEIANKLLKKSIHKRVYWQGKRFNDIFEYVQWTVGAKSSELLTSIESNLLNFVLGIQIGNHQQAFDVINDVQYNQKNLGSNTLELNKKTESFQQDQKRQCTDLAKKVKEKCLHLVVQNDMKALLLLNIGRLFALSIMFGSEPGESDVVRDFSIISKQLELEVQEE